MINSMKVLVFSWSGTIFALSTNAFAGVGIVDVEPTPMFPRQKEGEPLRQMARLIVNGVEKSAKAQVRIEMGGKKEDIQSVTFRKSTLTDHKKRDSRNPLKPVKRQVICADVYVPDINKPSILKVEILGKDGKSVQASRTIDWQPQKKWRIYCVSYCHQDLGFGDYPHRLRTTVRHANISFPLKYCRETDHWPEHEKYRFTIETSEPIPTYIGFSGKAKALELGKRIREGRIDVGGLHNTAHIVQYSHELNARQFYLSARHVPDLLDVKRGRVVQQDDVVGLTRSLPTYAVDAGYEFLFHGYNRLTYPDAYSGRRFAADAALETGMGTSTYALAREPVFTFVSPAGSEILTYAGSYSTYSLQWNPHRDTGEKVLTTERMEALLAGFIRRKWPFDVMPSQDATDFKLAVRTNADRIHDWNARYSYPRLINATWPMYFDALKVEMKKLGYTRKRETEDVNNQWTDQDSTDAAVFARARIAGEAIPATEKIAAMAQILSGGAATWTDIYQAYHRLLQYHEHTNAKNKMGNDIRALQWYETELAENEEMVVEAEEFNIKVRRDAQQRLAQAVTRKAGKNLLVFNPLARLRTDIVRCSADDIPEGMQPVDATTGKAAECQRLAEGTVLFVARDVPATGYRTYRLEKGNGQPVKDVRRDVIENDYYRMTVGANGAISSLRDKGLDVELIEVDTPHGFGGYLFQRKSGPGSGLHGIENADMSICSGSVADIVSAKGNAQGANEIRQVIVMYRHINRIDFELFVDRKPSLFVKGRGRKRRSKGGFAKEAVFVALPFNVPGFTLKHEVPGGVNEPFREQVEGTCTAHYTVRGFTDVHNDKYGVTVSPINCSQICYGGPRSSPILGDLSVFDRRQEYPDNSRIYLYMMNNMFSCNIKLSQAGPATFRWAIRSHPGDWKKGRADLFGRNVLQPLIAWRADGENKGAWPAVGSLMTVDQPNVTCSTIKPAEANGRGMIMRFNETLGKETVVTVTVPAMGGISSVMETSIVEDDRRPLKLIGKDAFAFSIKPFGVKTVRIIRNPAGQIPVPAGVKAMAVADMKTELKWNCDMNKGTISHFNVYRDTDKACEPTMLNYIGQSATTGYIDKPTLNHGGWIRNTLEPGTTYYYRVAAVDRWNNTGKASESFAVTTMKSEEKNLPPTKVLCLRAIPVSPVITQFNFVNLLFRTSCESDIASYEIHRSVKPGFTPGAETLIGKVGSDDIIPGGKGYGKTGVDYPVKDFDHAMYFDRSVKPGTTYYFKVCSVDKAGQKGEFSNEEAITTR